VCEVSSPAAARAAPTIFANVIAPGRITLADTRYSRKRRGVVLHGLVGEELFQFLHLLAVGGGVLPRAST
jgi:hypothetical protein